MRQAQNTFHKTPYGMKTDKIYFVLVFFIEFIKN